MLDLLVLQPSEIQEVTLEVDGSVATADVSWAQTVLGVDVTDSYTWSWGRGRLTLSHPDGVYPTYVKVEYVPVDARGLRLTLGMASAMQPSLLGNVFQRGVRCLLRDQGDDYLHPRSGAGLLRSLEGVTDETEARNLAREACSRFSAQQHPVHPSGYVESFELRDVEKTVSGNTSTIVVQLLVTLVVEGEKIYQFYAHEVA